MNIEARERQTLTGKKFKKRRKWREHREKKKTNIKTDTFANAKKMGTPIAMCALSSQTKGKYFNFSVVYKINFVLNNQSNEINKIKILISFFVCRWKKMCRARKKTRKFRGREHKSTMEKEGHQQTNLVYEKRHHQRKKKTIIAFMLTFLYIWDNRRIKCISTEENNNGYFRELKSFANIYFHFFFYSNVIICIWMVCASVFFIYMGVRLAATY